MWRAVLPAAARAGWRALAPDLPGYGDSPLASDGTWETHVAAFGAFHDALELGPVVLAVHDWGGLIGLRWACEHPDAVRGLVISASGFFADGRWHGLAEALRTEGQGEELARQMTRETFGGMLGAVSKLDAATVDEYWKAYDGERAAHRAARALPLGRLRRSSPHTPAGSRRSAFPRCSSGAPTTPFAPVTGARRFLAELPDAHLVLFEGEGHFVFDDAPALSAGVVAGFLDGLSG